jgi:phosphoglycerate dehydrogenase-like enzyme
VTTPRILSFLGPLPEVAAAVPGVSIRAIDPAGPLDDPAEGDVLVSLMRGAPNLEPVLNRGIRWVHAVGTGVDEFPLELLGDRLLTCSRGVNAVNVAEWTMAMLLTFEKQLPSQWVSEPPAQWGVVDLGALAGQTLAIVGFGAIGQALARRALAFDMTVRATRRRMVPSEIPGVHIVNDMSKLVAGADHVVLAAPATANTRGLADAAFFAAMKPGAHFVNVARAGLVDETALRAALDAGPVALASIDVSEPEPLPAQHWFYSHPRVRFSPHVSWSGPGLWNAAIGRLIENLGRWQQGRPLEGVVNVQEGY